MISEDLKKLLTKINSEFDPILIRCIPEKGAELDNCFPLVESKVAANGGYSVLGWHIRESKLLVEAIFHAVWKREDGELIDISPKPVPTKEILFVQDPCASYEGRQIDNIRLNILGNRLVDDLIEVCEASYRLQNKGERAYQHALTLKGKEAQAYQVFENAKPIIEMMVLQGLNHQSQCPCNSGKKYKVCHGKLFRDLAKSI
ncbi:SEC-C metal-binding domain-containing protein [Amphritea pacifica]|uniref:SEC-C domain-containing protein n=1 Tax=Amphritea pacifica TaxID=2811233 RepID=A0ABS2WCY1_9GAMM|nr:SEC-C domain-containing protein [Amphritea pacifica]